MRQQGSLLPITRVDPSNTHSTQVDAITMYAIMNYNLNKGRTNK